MADWSKEDIDQLRSLWEDGLSSIAIGLRMQRSKNAIIGAAHRFDLPARPSPIKRDGETKRTPQPRRVQAKATLPPLASATTTHIPTQSTAPIYVPPKRLTPPRAVVEPKPTKYGKVVECCWPTTDRRPWLFCEAASVPGKQYCPEHARLAHPPRASQSWTTERDLEVGRLDPDAPARPARMAPGMPEDIEIAA